MMEVRYKEREYLKDYCLDIKLFKKFNLTVKDVIPIRKVFIVVTEEGDFILKKLDYDVEGLYFISHGLEYIRRNGFRRTFNFRKTIDGKIYETYKGENYCMINLINGRECVYSNPVDVTLATDTLALLHKSSKGFYSEFRNRDNRGKIIEKLQEELNQIKLLKNMVLSYREKKELDEIFLDNVDYLIEKANESISILNKSSYYSICNKEDKVAFCHHDLAYHNIIIKDEEAYFIDFDYAIIDLKVHDMANYIYRVIKSFGYDIEKAKYIIEEYSNNYYIDKDELEVLHGIMSFPHRKFILFRNYYFRQKDWEYSSFLQKAINKCDFKDEEEEFLQKFNDVFLHNK
ncbi:CotS family spore coat protein [Hathewaya histolytica]|uniref:CotS family spore coat protein n=1 Tax=Hathewaya histolytica TaxID=1498 RepID=A0A4U9RQ03_HATHI|nr:CotS family spore coat protein [Hathewaya histolytica]VTQ94285.1 CotS family spore coat protein [Hathewaya histolytica]